jgi:2-dehydro-3-deoxyphosphogluconate aldolase/(4S)-4-hydroxy-2-oxoglutarate aldolase
MIIETLRRSRIIPVLVIDDAADAVPLATTLRDARVTCLEITLRRPAALDAIRRILAEVEGVTVGAGTVTSRSQLAELQKIGAAFAISPGLSTTLVRAAQDCGMPYLPGVITPSEVMCGLELGLRAFKFFPAGVMGGVAALRAFNDVFAEVAFCPTGGIGPDNAKDYLALPNVAAVGSSWLVPSDLLKARDWAGIATRAATLRASAGVPG